MTKTNSLAASIKQLIIFLAFVAAALLISRQVNSWLGKQAIEKTGLTSMSYQEALQASESTGKPVLLKFAAVWCGACRQLDLKVFTDEEVKTQLTKNFYYVRLDYDNAADTVIFRRYGIQGFPVLALVDGRGDLLTYLKTPSTPQALLQQFNAIAP